MKTTFLALALVVFGWTASAQVSLWSNNVTPANPGNCSDSSTELGLRFQSSVAGQITAIRFYKGTQNTGTHVGRLWTASRTLLAQVTFTNETASGWQQQSLTTPVAIAANTVYIVSYTSPSGYYALDQSYFTDKPYTSGVLTALESSVNSGGASNGGGNGVYARPGGTFPSNNSTSNSNSYVDVVFVQNTQSVVLVWSAVSGATSYNVYRSTVSGGPYSLLASSNVLTATDATVQSGVTYYYVVKSFSGGVESMASPQIAVTIASN